MTSCLRPGERGQPTQARNGPERTASSPQLRGLILICDCGSNVRFCEIWILRDDLRDFVSCLMKVLDRANRNPRTGNHRRVVRDPTILSDLADFRFVSLA